MYIENAFLSGTLNMVVRDENGKIKQHKTVRNRVMDQGLAHIVGRMIDDTHGMKFDAGQRSHMLPKAMRFMGIGTGSTANSNASGSPGKGDEWCLETEKTINQFSMFGPKGGIAPVRATGTAVLTGGVLTGIRITDKGLGYDSTGGAITVTIGANGTGGSGAAATATIVNTFVDEITITAGGSGYDHATAVPTIEFALPPGLAANGDVSSAALMTDNTNVNTASGLSNTDHETEAGFVFSGGTSAGKTFNGRVDMSADARNYATGELTYLGQGDTDAASLLLEKETSGNTSEGEYFTDANGTTRRTSFKPTGNTQGHLSNFYKKSVGGTLIKQKKVGKKLIFIAVFPPNTPSNEVALGITEAGIFNEPGPGNTAIAAAAAGRKSYNPFDQSESAAATVGRLREQTMLCRTVFAVVTKQQADTLQITWTIEFSDNTA